MYWDEKKGSVFVILKLVGVPEEAIPRLRELLELGGRNNDEVMAGVAVSAVATGLRSWSGRLHYAAVLGHMKRDKKWGTYTVEIKVNVVMPTSFPSLTDNNFIIYPPISVLKAIFSAIDPKAFPDQEVIVEGKR